MNSAILSLRPNISREQAVQQFESRGPSGLIRSLIRGALRSTADIYVPVHVFQVEVRNSAAGEARLFAIDAVSGSLDLYSFERIPGATETVSVATRNHPAPVLNPDVARDIVVERVRRMVFARGLFRIRDLHIHAQPVAMELHVPYWVGFFGPAQRLRIAVLDAVRRRMEGAKVRRLIHDWLSNTQV